MIFRYVFRFFAGLGLTRRSACLRIRLYVCAMAAYWSMHNGSSAEPDITRPAETVVSAGFLVFHRRLTTKSSSRLDRATWAEASTPLAWRCSSYLRARIVRCPHDGGARLEVVSSRLPCAAPTRWSARLRSIAKHVNGTVPTVFAEIDSDIPLAAGLGSSAAATVAGLRSSSM
jgi:hypothetical protein